MVKVFLSSIVFALLLLGNASANTALFNNAQTVWSAAAHEDCELPKKLINFPIWADSEYTSRRDWNRLCKQFSRHSQQASNTYGQELGQLFHYKTINLGSDYQTAYRKHYRLITFMTENQNQLTDVKLVLATWMPLKRQRPNKKSGISFLYDCKEQNCKLVGIADRLLFSQ